MSDLWCFAYSKKLMRWRRWSEIFLIIAAGVLMLSVSIWLLV